jgi:hypothetical protein
MLASELYVHLHLEEYCALIFLRPRLQIFIHAKEPIFITNAKYFSRENVYAYSRFIGLDWHKREVQEHLRLRLEL